MYQHWGRGLIGAAELPEHPNLLRGDETQLTNCRETPPSNQPRDRERWSAEMEGSGLGLRGGRGWADGRKEVTRGGGGAQGII